MVWILEYSFQIISDFFYVSFMLLKGNLCPHPRSFFLGWHKMREFQFSHLVLSLYTIIAAFIALNCCWKRQPLLSHYLYIFLSPTIHYNAFVFCQCYQRQPVFIRYPLDVLYCGRCCQGPLFRMKHYFGRRWQFFSTGHNFTFYCGLGHHIGQITHYVPWALLGFSRNVSVSVVCLRWIPCNMAFGWICKCKEKR